MTRLGPKRTDSRKKAVSTRLSSSDIRQIKQLAERLEARESDVIRFAIKTMLEQLAPLQDPKANGRSLVPVFIEWGAELMRHFELDASKLSAIINDGVDDARRVEPDDIQLILMNGSPRSHRLLRVPGVRKTNGGGSNGSDEPDTPETTVKRYLYEKYLTNAAAGTTNGSGAPV